MEEFKKKIVNKQQLRKLIIKYQTYLNSKDLSNRFAIKTLEHSSWAVALAVLPNPNAYTQKYFNINNINQQAKA